MNLGLIIIAVMCGAVFGASMENLHQRHLKDYIKNLEARIRSNSHEI